MAIAWVPRLEGAPSSEPVKHHFSIESEPLGAALQEFAKQSGVQIIFFSQVTEGIKAPALNGQYTIADALQILLSGSHLTFRVINPNTIEIRASVPADSFDEWKGCADRARNAKMRAESANEKAQKQTVDSLNALASGRFRAPIWPPACAPATTLIHIDVRH